MARCGALSPLKPPSPFEWENPGSVARFPCRPRPEMEIQTAGVGTGFSSLSRVKTCGTAYHGDIGLPTCPGDVFFHFLSRM